MSSEHLESYLSGRWVRGEGVETRLVDPVKGDELATASTKGVDLKAALEFARTQGQGGLRTMSYAERGKLVGALADVLIANRARYEAIAVAKRIPPARCSNRSRSVRLMYAIGSKGTTRSAPGVGGSAGPSEGI